MRRDNDYRIPILEAKLRQINSTKGDTMTTKKASKTMPRDKRKWERRIAKLDKYEIDDTAQYSVSQFAEMMECCESSVGVLCEGWTRQELINRINAELEM